MSCHPRLAGGLLPVLLAATLGCQGQPAPATPTEKADAPQALALNEGAREKALAAKEALFARLSGRLTEVMQADGPAKAIEVCSREAAELAKTVGQEQGVAIGRTARKLRNPANKPPDWVERLIAEPSAEPQFVELDGGGTGALLPIKLQAKCTTCHGTQEQIPDEVQTQLDKLYPDDQATGFREGDLRGWFWVEVPPG